MSLPTVPHPEPARPWRADYSRLENTAFGRRRLRQLQAIVVGAGALGNEVVKALGLLGIGQMMIIDPDIVEPSNLTRSILFRTAGAAGSNKARALAQAAAPIFPDTEIEAVEEEIAGLGFRRIAAADILFSCVDSELARLEIAYIATKLDRPVCDAGLGGHNYSHGRVTFFPGRAAACYGCGLSGSKRRQLLTTWQSAVRSCWTHAAPAEERSYPSTPTMAAVIGAMQVEVGLRRLLEHASEAQSIELTLAPTVRAETFVLRRSEGCPFHAPEACLISEPDAEAVRGGRLAIADLLASAPPVAGAEPVLLLDWPICVRARCGACGERWPPMQRMAVIRRRGACPRCGSNQVIEEETISRVNRSMPWARLTPAELGLPERHLHTIRFEKDELQ